MMILWLCVIQALGPLGMAVGAVSGAEGKAPLTDVRGSSKQTLPGAGVTYRSDLPLAEPVLTTDARIAARRASTWEDHSQANVVRWLVLEEQVEVGSGIYGVRAQRAVVRIDTENRFGQRIAHVMAYLDQARPLAGGSVITAEAPRLLVTLSTSGDVLLEVDDFTEDFVADNQLVADAMGRFERHLATISSPLIAVPAEPPLTPPAMLSKRDESRQDIAQQQMALLLPPGITPEPLLATRSPAAETALGPEGIAQPSEVREAIALLPATPTIVTPKLPVPPSTPPGSQAPAPGSEAPGSQAPGSQAPGSQAPGSQSPGMQAVTQEQVGRQEVAAEEGVVAVTPVVPAEAGQAVTRPAGAADTNILPQDGVVSFSAQRIIYSPAQSDDEETVLILAGNVQLAYQQASSGRSYTLQAEKIVVFLTPKAEAPGPGQRMGAEMVRGIYLEDNVIATDGQYTLRAPRVYYDPARNQAILLQAVLYTWDMREQAPIYLRAKQLRQVARQQWEARSALLTNSEFAEPHVSVGASRLTFDQTPGPDGKAQGRYVAKGATLRWGKVPVFGWPVVGGTTAQIPLEDVNVGFSDRDGPNVRTRWDVFNLMNQPKPDGVKMTGDIDYRGERGPGLGLNLDYDLPEMLGQVQTYGLLFDEGEDRVSDRNGIGFDQEPRGFAHLQHRQYLQDNWELTLEGAYVSDPTFLETFFSGQAYEAKPYETSLYLKKQQDDWALTFLASSSLNSFSPQLPVLQTPGYTVEKLPELGWWQVGTDLWDDRLTYFGQTSVGRMRILGGSDSPAERGFTNAQSLQAFGFPATTDFGDNLELSGISDESRLRLDTRHELDAPLRWGILDFTPYVAGRATVYDQDYENYDPDAENARLWGTTGVRSSTQFARTYEGAQSNVLDVHGLRHVIEPYADVFAMGATVDAGSYPIYDQDVEGIDEGYGTRLGVRNTLQTRRGGPGRWRSVDWVVFDNALTLRGDEANPDADVPASFGYRPELGTGGDNLHSGLMWMLSDTFTTMADSTYGLEDEELEQWRVGGELAHSRWLTLFSSFTRLEDLDRSLLRYGFSYRLSRKYSMALSHTLDFEQEHLSRRLDVSLDRRLPRWRLRLEASFDQIDGDTVFSVVLVPEGLGLEAPSRDAGFLID
ncbi:MAG: LPS assembly protein LptD [Phycisphaeraceae bacterium]|nr:LPS assembly protein LptD [Phycisphaeraceae bacterium]